MRFDNLLSLISNLDMKGHRLGISSPTFFPAEITFCVKSFDLKLLLTQDVCSPRPHCVGFVYLWLQNDFIQGNRGDISVTYNTSNLDIIVF